MAARSYEAGFRKYYGDRLTNISDDTSDEEIRQVYDHWARYYDKVIKMYQIKSTDYTGSTRFLSSSSPTPTPFQELEDKIWCYQFFKKLKF